MTGGVWILCMGAESGQNHKTRSAASDGTSRYDGALALHIERRGTHELVL